MFYKLLKKKDYLKVMILTVLIIIMFSQMNLFKKIYFVFTRDYETRLVNSYEYCGKESIGFLSDVKKNFQIDYRIPIVNFTSSPNSSWYYNNLKNIKNKKVIFLNYDSDYKVNTKYSQNLRDYKILLQYNNCYLLDIK
jgi:acid phosphatase class B|tara:strand:- start:875 stop:1288 length:414 start_codon:yes stop_codon:yes gene_type:complete